MSSSGRSRRSQMDSSSVASSDGFAEDNLSIDVERDEVKRKSRNLSEKKRRDQFNMLINELCSMVNLEPNEDAASSGNKKMDKSSVLRATITFLKNHSEEAAANEMESENSLPDNQSTIQSFINSWKPSFLSTEEFSHLSLEALDAFILVFDADTEGKIIYASESIFPLLGISASYLLDKSSSQFPSNYQPPSSSCATLSACTTLSSLTINSNSDNETLNHHLKASVYDIIHESEKQPLRKLVMEAANCGKPDEFFSMMVHFRHRSTNLNQIDEESEDSFYELVRLVGAFRRIDDYMGFGAPRNCFWTICRLQTPKLIKELHILSPFSQDLTGMKDNEFISRHSLEWKFLFLDPRAPMIIGYLPFEVLGTSGYDYYHWDDLDLVIAGHQRLMQIGSGESCYYRFLTKGQQWIWLRTKYFITYHMWNSKPEFVMCTHTVMDWDEKSVNKAEEESLNHPYHLYRYDYDMNSPRDVTSSDYQVDNKSSQWNVNEFSDQENINDQPAYDKMTVNYTSNDSERSTPYPMSTINMVTGVEGCLSLASSSNSSADYIMNNSMYDPSSYLMNQQAPVSPSNQQQQSNTLIDQQRQSHNLQKQPSLAPPSHLPSPSAPPQHVSSPALQSNSVLPSQPSSSSCHQQQLIEQSHHLQQQPFNSSNALVKAGPMVSNSVISVSQYSNMSTESSQASYANLSEFLRKKHQLLQKQIKEQQEELRRVSEQLMMTHDVKDPNSPQTQPQAQPQAQQQQQPMATMSGSGQHEIKSEFTQLQSSSLGSNLQSLQPNPTEDSAVRSESELSGTGVVYIDLSCSDHTLITRDFPENQQ